MSNFRAVISSGDKSTFANMINKTKQCLSSKNISHPISRENYRESLRCETAYFSENDDFTYHTHPNGSVEPSQMDKNTTNKFNKKFMFIGLVPSREVIVYSASDNFNSIVGRFKV